MIIDPDFAEVDEPIVTVRMTKSQAEELSHGLSDLACWARGFNAALHPDDHDRRPFGIEYVRELNIALKKAIEAAQ